MAIPLGYMVYRIHSFKRYNVDGFPQTFCNRHDFLILEGETQARKKSENDFVAVAEQHILQSACSLEMRVGVEATIANNPGLEFKAYAEWDRRFGKGNGTGPEGPAPYPLVMTLAKHCYHGRSGRYFFIGALKNRDVIVSADGRVALSKWGGYHQLQYQYFNSYMMQGPFKPYVTNLRPGNSVPDTARLVWRFGDFQAMRLTSVPSAQKRKTIRAWPYRQRCHDWVLQIQDVGNDYNRLCYRTSANVPKTQLLTFQNKLNSLYTNWKFVMEYYSEGLQPSLAPEWRPTAGLDPWISESQYIGSKMVEVIERFRDDLQRLMEQPGSSVSNILLQALEHRNWQLSGMYALFFERERFTGTPIPHANV